MAAATARAPWGLCAASRMTVGDAGRSPAGPASDLGQRRPYRLGVEPAVERLASGEGLDRRDRAGGVVRLMGAVQRRKTSSYVPPSPDTEISWPPTAGARCEHPELDALARHRRADLGGPAQQHLGDLDLLLGEHGDAPGLMIPAFSTATSAGVSPSSGEWSTPTGVTTATAASTMLVTSHVPPSRPRRRRVDRGVRERGERHRGDGLEERQRVRRRRRPARRTAAPRRTARRSAHALTGLPSTAIRSAWCRARGW